MGTTVTSDQFQAGVSQLDVALEHVARIEDVRIDRGLIATQVCAALGAWYEAWADIGDSHAVHALREQANAGLQSALETLQTVASDDPHVDAACRALAPCFQQLRQLHAGLALDRPDLPQPKPDSVAQASVAEPSLIAGRGRVLRPAVPIPRTTAAAEASAPTAAKAPTKAASIADVEALIERASQLPPPLPETKPTPVSVRPETPFESTRLPELVLGERALGCWEDLAALSAMRRVDEQDVWSDVARTEQRLLTRIDALVALGEQRLSELVTRLADRPVADPELTWALMLTYGSLRHCDAADQCLRIARTIPLDDTDMFEAARDAITLAPNPLVQAGAARWVTSHDSRLRALAIATMGRLGALTAAQAQDALRDPVSHVVATVLEALALPQRDAATASLPVQPWLEHDVDAVADAALFATAIHAPHVLTAPVRQRIETKSAARADAFMLLALTQDEQAWPLLQLAAADDDIGALEALGWFGSLQAADRLLAALQRDDDSIRQMAARSLFRITGVPLVDDGPAPSAQHNANVWTLAATPQLIEQPTCNAETWAQWLSEHRMRAQSGARYRFGRPYTLLDNVWELSADASRGRARRFAWLELRARMRDQTCFNERAFVVTQRRQLASLQTQVQSRPMTPGAWPIRS